MYRLFAFKYGHSTYIAQLFGIVQLRALALDTSIQWKPTPNSPTSPAERSLVAGDNEFDVNLYLPASVI